jgi:hypothetical protein
MSNPAFNLAQCAIHPNWYDHLPAAEAAMADADRCTWARIDAGWEGDEGGWYAPDGTHESDWAAEGYPFPEDVAEYRAWHSAFHHYDAQDAGAPQPDPYPEAPAHRRACYALPCPG